jgi:hypothetical protein
MVGLVGAGVSMLAWLARRPKASRISVELVRDDALRSSTIISGRITDSLAPSSSSDVLPSVSERGTVTIESVGNGELSTCVRGERSTTSSLTSMVMLPLDMLPSSRAVGYDRQLDMTERKFASPPYGTTEPFASGARFRSADGAGVERVSRGRKLVSGAGLESYNAVTLWVLLFRLHSCKRTKSGTAQQDRTAREKRATTRNRGNDFLNRLERSIKEALD